MDWDWIKFGALSVAKQLTDTTGNMPHFKPKIATEVDCIVAMCQIVRSGMGIAAVPRHLVLDDLRNGNLIVVPLSLDLFAPGVFAVWPDNVSEKSLVLKLVRFLADRLSVV